MRISNAFQSGLSGLSVGMEGMRRSAAEIASRGQMDGTARRDLAEPLVEQTLSLRQAEASAKVVTAADAMVGALLDVRA